MSNINSLSSPTEPSTCPPEQHHLRSLDGTIEHCVSPNLSWKQFLQCIIVSFAWFFDAQQTFISVFTDAEPKWTCKKHFSCNYETTDICQLPRDSWSWVSPARTSIVSEWSLECAGPIITGLPASSFFLGCLVGGFALASLADSSLGRKNLLVLSCLLMSLPGLLTAFSTNIWMYCGWRFISGFGRATIGTCALVHASELVAEKWRARVGVIGFLCFTLGFLSLPAIAFLLRSCSWRLIYLWTCVPCVFYSLLVYFSVHESPRWLFIKGKKQEFAKTLRSMSAPEHWSTLTESFLSHSMEWGETESEELGICSALAILLQKSWAFQRLAVVTLAGFGIGMIYYGIPLGLSNLSFDVYLSATFNALSELPVTLAMFFVMGKLRRKGTVVGLALLSGICCPASALVRWKGLQIALEIVSFFMARAAFDVLLIYTLELFPTCVRNSAVSMVRQASLFGGVLGPALAAVGRKKGLLSYGVFGATISVCGLLIAWLPETKGRVLCDTMEEEEECNKQWLHK
ncbi:organic cation/carnitine transporter 3-like [Sesamum indicum]|uniref:Organic cation/carnitine transporter 3-like n=1 Tax=Sesamum indicum TaxID=4182 RepID=A0A6I9TZU2_SESIN|nr:organic cation/carnitine transporter 3-like [Sesamum indicum]